MKQSMMELGDYSSTSRNQTVACGELPQHRFDHFGATALSDTELLALMLQNGLNRQNVLPLASKLIAEAGSIGGLATWHQTDFCRLKGIGQSKAQQLVAVIEIARRMMKQTDIQNPILNRPELIAAHLKPYTAGLAIEKFWVMCLNRKNRLIKLTEVTSGTATSSLAHPREVFREAIRHGATAIVCAHNHPSGDPGPSAADVQVTRLWERSHKRVYGKRPIMGSGPQRSSAVRRKSRSRSARYFP